MKNKKILVTGGASGIGKAISKLMIEAGATVIIFSRNEERGKEVIDALMKSGGKAYFIKTDLFDSQSIASSLKKVHEEIGPVDILINNAAISGFMGPVTSTPLEDLSEVLKVNLESAFQLSKSVVPTMMENSFGRIVNISSVASRVTPPNSATYNMSKAALDALTKSLSREVASYGITVNSIAPGLILTDRIVESRLPGIAAKTGNSTEKVLELMTQQTDTKKLTTEIEIAEVVRFLCSDAAKNITGEIINMSGGF